MWEVVPGLEPPLGLKAASAGIMHARVCYTTPSRATSISHKK